MSLSIPVTLTSFKNPADKRYLNVIPSTPILIGRASKSESKNLQPSSTNALFDCPVISREHAEIRIKRGLTATSADQVTIMDKGSMHGTYVNGQKLEKFSTFPLWNGDFVQFGTRVTRGPDTHDGVHVTFNKEDTSTTTTTTKKGYHYPSDNELSEDEDSDGSDVSDEEEDDEPVISSAKTTPEQPKSQPGSAQQPIDLTSMPPPPPRPTIIDLVDDARDDIFYSSTYRPKSPILPPRRNMEALKYKLVDVDGHAFSQDSYQPATKLGKSKMPELIQDSVDRNVEVLVPESIPLARLDSVGGDEDSVLNHNTGLTGLLNNEHEVTSDRDEDEIESEAEADAEDLEEDEIDGDDFEEDADHLSESNYSDLYDDLRDEDDDEFHSYSAKKNVSPELASAIPAKSAPSTQVPFKVGSQWTLGTQVKPATQSYYDPVRASQPGATTYGNSMQSLPTKVASAPTAQPYKPCVYAAPPISANDASVNTHTDVSSSSRWDVPPATNIYNPTFSTFGPAPFSSRPYMYGCAYPSIYADTLRADAAQPYSFSQGWNNLPESPAVDYFETPVDTLPKQAPVESAAKKQMKISDMVEKATESVKDAVNGAEETILTGGKKRKADEMLHEEPALPAASVSEQATEVRDVVMDESHDYIADDVQEPPTQRRKIEEPANTKGGRSIAGGIAKYATAAAFGGAGTVAFLCSPLAERLIEWLA